ncbi:MAG: hypothetical protein ACRDOY_01605, partial [Nocardioidaceae bacterium]
HQTAEFGAFLDPGADIAAEIGRAFPSSSHDRLRVAKSAGVLHSPEALRRLKEHNAESRLIVMLRDPVVRAHSAYWFARRTGDERIPSFAAALAAEESRADVPPARRPWVAYRARSHYLEPLRAAAALFGPENLTITLLEDFAADRLGTLAKLQTWLGLERHELTAAPTMNAARGARSPTVARLVRSNSATTRVARRVLPRSTARRIRRVVNSANERPVTVTPLDEELRAELARSFAAHNKALADEFGVDVSRWSH